MSSSRNCFSLFVVIQDQWVLLLPWNLATVPACINHINVWEKFLLPLFHMTFPQYLEDRSSTVIQLALQKTSNRTNVRWSWLWIIYLLKAACVPFHLLRLITKQYKRSESFEWCETLEEIIIINLSKVAILPHHYHYHISGCHITFYCSREHQKLHWKLHKSQCCAYKVTTPSELFALILHLLHVAGLQLPQPGPLPSGHPGPQARGDDHLRWVTIISHHQSSMMNHLNHKSSMMNPLRDAAGDRPPGSDPASLPRLLQASHQQICVSRNLTTLSTREFPSLLSQLCQLLVSGKWQW